VKKNADQPSLYVLHQGEVVGRIPTTRELLEKIDELELTVEDLERERRQQRAQIRKLKAELDRTPAHYDRAGEVENIINEWRIVCKHPNARSSLDRFDAVRRLLDVTHPRPYPREAFTLAIQGAVYDPYRRPRRNGTLQAYDDIELICRTAAKFEEFIRRAPR
jgi:hypothetical protein